MKGHVPCCWRMRDLGRVNVRVAPWGREAQSRSPGEIFHETSTLWFSLFLPTPTLGPSCVKGMIKGQEITMRGRLGGSVD